MFDALPSHVSDMQQTIDTTEVEERTVIGEVLDHTGEDLAFLEIFQQSFALGAVFFFDHGAARDHHIVATLIQFDQFEVQLFAFEIAGIAHRTHIHQRSGQEGANVAEFDGEAAFDLATDGAGDGFVAFHRLFQTHPCFSALGFLTRHTGFAKAVFGRFQSDFYFITDLNFQLAFLVVELLNGDHTFGFQTGIDQYDVVSDVDNFAKKNGSGPHLGGGHALFEHLRKTFAHVIV